MSNPVTADDARGALADVERGRRAVVNEFGMPQWYWWSLGLGWLALGVINDLGHPWATLAATAVFGVAHATIYNVVAAGRHRTNRLTIRRSAVSWSARVAVIACLVALVGVEIIGAIAADRDGAGHPVTIATIPIAVAIVLGGPRLTDAIRRRAARPQNDA